MRVNILELIRFDLKRLDELQDESELEKQELNMHLARMEQAMLLERDEGGYKPTLRCFAYLDQSHGYELRR